MKRTLLSLLLASSLPAGVAFASCGLKPLPPLGCNYDDAVCICDSDGNCSWFFAGCGYSTYLESVGSDLSVAEEAKRNLGTLKSRPKYLPSPEEA